MYYARGIRDVVRVIRNRNVCYHKSKSSDPPTLISEIEYISDPTQTSNIVNEFLTSIVTNSNNDIVSSYDDPLQCLAL